MQNGKDQPELSKLDHDRPNTDFVEVILKDLGGTFKKYQILNYILFCIPFALSGTFALSYVFTALNLDYRFKMPMELCCPNNRGRLEVPQWTRMIFCGKTSLSQKYNYSADRKPICEWVVECEVLDGATYEPIWLSNAVPYKNQRPLTCDRYESIAFSSECEIDNFNHSNIHRCDQFIYATDEVSILNEYGMECDENVWKLAMVGTANNIGRFIFTPLMGYGSDRFGRRAILVIGVLGSTIFGYIRAVAPNYLTFVFFEFLDAGIGSVTYSASFILAMEWIGIRHRVLLISIVTATYPFGQIFLGLTARAIRDYRTLLKIIYAPGFLILIYFWIAPESIRWLIVNGKKKRTMATLRRAERINGVQLSQNTIDVINMELTDSQNKRTVQTNTLKNLAEIFKKRLFIIRFLVCCFAWISTAFVSYGISLTSISLAGDKYVNFVVIAIGGVPAMLVFYFMMERCGRRWTLFSCLLIGGASILCSKLLPSDLSGLSITFFFIGKVFITVAFTSLYVYTNELWPTNMRHSIMGLCSTMGRVGAMFAPLAPILSQYMDILPYLLFGVMALAAAILILLLPETRNIKLPDTMDEAEKIGTENEGK